MIAILDQVMAVITHPMIKFFLSFAFSYWIFRR